MLILYHRFYELLCINRAKAGNGIIKYLLLIFFTLVANHMEPT
jgi:hypothetical protein